MTTSEMAERQQLIHDSLVLEQRIVTTKWLAFKLGISYDEAQKELYEFWKKQQENIPALQGTFVSIRPLSQDPGGMNGVHVAIITRDELLPEEEEVVYSLQITMTIDPNIILAMNRQIEVPPRLFLASVLEARSAAKIKNVMTTPTPTITTTLTSSLPSETKAVLANPKGIKSKRTIGNSSKRGKSFFPPQKKTEKISSPPKNEKGLFAMEFSSSEDELPGGASEMEIDTTLAVTLDKALDTTLAITPDKALDPTSPPLETKSAEPSPSIKKTKPIKVPRTFMENGYLMTEYVTEMIEDQSNDGYNKVKGGGDEAVTEANHKKTNPSVAKINHIATKTNSSLTATTTTKQGSILSFFKSKTGQ